MQKHSQYFLRRVKILVHCPKLWKVLFRVPPTVLAVLIFPLVLSCASFPSPSILANQSNTTSRTIDGTGLPWDPRWWTLRTSTVSEVEIDNSTIVAPKYSAMEAELVFIWYIPHLVLRINWWVMNYRINCRIDMNYVNKIVQIVKP